MKQHNVPHSNSKVHICQRRALRLVAEKHHTVIPDYQFSFLFDPLKIVDGPLRVCKNFVGIVNALIVIFTRTYPMQPDSPSVRDLLFAKFETLFAECDLVADNAAFGQTLDDMDEFFLIKGRKFLQETFEANGMTTGNTQNNAYKI